MKKRKNKANMADMATRWVGSFPSIVAHSAAFAIFFAAGILGAAWDTVLLVLTTIVSLEAIYLAIFIQMTVNQNTQSLQEVESDIDEIQDDVEELSEDVGEIQEDVEELSEDVGEIQEDVEGLSEEEKAAALEGKTEAVLTDIKATLARLTEEIERLKSGKNGQ